MSKIKILYVEDEPFLGKIVKESLESRGYSVTMITDGLKVMSAFTSDHPDICVLDIMLPGKDGLSIGQEIKSNNPAMPIIFLTAKSQTDDIVKGFQSGGNDYIKKPFSMEELIVRVENLLSLHQQRDQHKETQMYHLRSFIFNPSILELTSPAQKIKLSHKENELLKMLAQFPNQAIERGKILQKIWGMIIFLIRAI